MKKLIIGITLICAFTLTNLFNGVAYASSTEKDAVKAKLVEEKIPKEKEDKIKSLMDRYIKEATSPTVLSDKDKEMIIDKFNIKEASATYILPDLFLSQYNEKDGLMKLITKDSRINIKVSGKNGQKGISSFAFDESDEAQLLGTVTNIREDSLIPDYDTLASIISEKVSDVKKIKFAHSFRYYVTFVIIKAKDNEYLIPYSTAPDIIGLTNGKVYTSYEVITTMSSIFDEKAAIEQGDLNNGTPLKSPKNYVSTFGVITLILASLTVITVINNKKKKRYSR